MAAAIAADPSEGRRWGVAYATAAFAADLALARAALATGDVDRAEAALLRASRREAPERAEAEVLLGDLASRRGDTAGAEARYRAALAARPGLTAAVVGLNGSLRSQGRFAEADALAVRGGQGAGNPRADALRAEARATQDPEAAMRLLREALTAAPSDVGLRLDLARALARLDGAAEGRAILEAAATTPEGIYAAALHAREEGRVADAMQWLARVPDRLRDANGVRLMVLLRLDAEVAAAAGPAGRGSVEEARRNLLAIAVRPDPSGAAPSAAVRALIAAGDREFAATAARAAARVPRAPVGQLALAGVLLDAGLRGDAEALLGGLGGDGRLTAGEARQVALLRASAGAAATTVARAAEAPPARPEPVAFAGGESRSPREVLGIAEAVLRRDPRNAAARYAAIEAALALEDLGRAEALLQAGQATAPNDPRIALLDARVARRSGDTRRAQAALTVASEQRRAQIGADRGGAVALAAARPAESSRRVPLAGDGQGSSFTTVGAIRAASRAAGRSRARRRSMIRC
ncbi:tetratricopeptide repeat protein [Roseomonas sp. CCTCC AB2023176]|uniref:tetratricopeptide repeat protein n=1 Tax=Roseomonas sp. CCTCC AB2023176 TaxID=3342640 RepID=UPI0035DE75AD